MAQSTPDLIKTAIERFQAEVPALAKLKLVFGLELRARGDIQVYRVEVPGPAITKGDHGDARCTVTLDRSQFNELAADGTLSQYRKAYEGGHIKATGDPGIIKLIVQVFERQEERGRIRKVH